MCSPIPWSVFVTISIIATTYLPVFCNDDDLNIVISKAGFGQQSRSKLKYVLLWNGYDEEPLSLFEETLTAYYTYDCPQKNCYISRDKNLFFGDLSNFDAIMFNGLRLSSNISTYPKERYEHQKYIYVNMEPPFRKVMCEDFLDGFFNWTCTYKLDSDVILKYFTILDINTNEPVGPKKDMQWISNMNNVSEEFATRIKSKTKAAVWFVSNCQARVRKQFMTYLNKVLKKYNLTIDIFGCGGTNLTCSRKNHQDCAAMIKKDYFFYMALENSFYDDYVSEKVLHGLLNYAVPIVYGGANYSRFLPPGSFINVKHYSAEGLAAIINFYVKDPSYLNFFKWRNHYKYVSTMPEDQSGSMRLFEESIYEGEGVCNLCKALNNDELFRTSSVYTKIRSWWHKDYEVYCRSMKRKNDFKNFKIK